MRALSVVLGILATLDGASRILLVLAFSTMIGQDLPDAARDAEQARAVSERIPEIGLGVVSIIVGIWLVSGKPRSRAAADPSPSRERRKARRSGSGPDPASTGGMGLGQADQRSE